MLPIVLQNKQNKLIVVGTIVLILFLLFFGLMAKKSTSSSTSHEATPTPMKGVVTNVGPFSVVLPNKEWIYQPEIGIDSQVGQFRGDGITLLFDYGHYSNPLAEDNDPRHTITYEMIDGRKAKIVRSKIPRQGLTGVFFENTDLPKPTEDIATPSASPSMLGTKKLEIHTEEIAPEKEELVLTIIRSIRFTSQ